jgi:hypothetical protein
MMAWHLLVRLGVYCCSLYRILCFIMNLVRRLHSLHPVVQITIADAKIVLIRNKPLIKDRKENLRCIGSTRLSLKPEARDKGAPGELGSKNPTTPLLRDAPYLSSIHPRTHNPNTQQTHDPSDVHPSDVRPNPSCQWTTHPSSHHMRYTRTSIKTAISLIRE